MSLSITRKYDLDIYVLKLSSVDDDLLGELFTALPLYYIILLEDIDTANTIYSRKYRTVGTVVYDSTRSLVKEKPGGKVTLSGLLNTIDSIGSQEG